MPIPVLGRIVDEVLIGEELYVVPNPAFCRSGKDMPKEAARIGVRSGVFIIS